MILGSPALRTLARMKLRAAVRRQLRRLRRPSGWIFMLLGLALIALWATSLVFGRSFRTPIADPRVIDGPFLLGDLKVTPFTLPHGRIDSTGFLFEQDGVKRFAYLNDCKEVPDDVVEAVRGVEWVALDGLRPILR